MLFEKLQIDVTDSSDVMFFNGDQTRTPAWLIKAGMRYTSAVAPLAEYRDLCERFGVS